MTISVDCTSCGHQFDVASDLAGGFSNCPRCHKATRVEGLKDSLWRVWQLAIFGVLVLIAWPVLNTAGWLAAAGVVFGGLALAWFISRAF